MPKVGRTASAQRYAAALRDEGQFVDLAVRLRLLVDDGSDTGALGDLVRLPSGKPVILGGRWDTWGSGWVSPQPDDLNVVEWTVQEQQLPLWFETPDEAQFVGLFAGRQAGKTYVAFQDMVADAFRSPGRAFGIVIQTFDALGEFRGAFESLFPPDDAWRIEWSAREKTHHLPNGARIIWRTAGGISNLRGPSLKRIHIEEAALYPYSVFTTAMGAGAAAKDFRLTLATTPKREIEWIRNINATWDPKKRSHIKGYFLHRLRTESNPRRNRPLLEAIKANTPAYLVRQEFGGELLDPEHKTYVPFDREKHEHPIPEVPAWLDVTKEFTASEFLRCDPKLGADFVIGWDFIKEAAVVGKIFREERKTFSNAGARQVQNVHHLVIIGEAVDERTTTQRHGKLVRDTEWWPGQKAQPGQKLNAVVITDAMGVHDNADGQGGDTAAIKLLQPFFRDVRPHGTKNPDVNLRVRTVENLLDGDKYGQRLWFLPGKAPKTINVLETQQMGPNHRPIKDGHEHPVDALGYLCLGTFPIEGQLPDGFRKVFSGGYQ